MKIHLIIAQRKESHGGRYGPEVLAAIDDHQNDLNGGRWLAQKADEYRNPDRAESDFEAVEIIIVEVPTEAVMERLRPTTKAIPAKVEPKVTPNEKVYVVRKFIHGLTGYFGLEENKPYIVQLEGDKVYSVGIGYKRELPSYTREQVLSFAERGIWKEIK